jgi:AcrR family transcriptional regulator
MSLYRYFDTREEILDGACARALGGISDDLDETATWEQQLTVAARDIYIALRTHPGVVDLLIAQGGLKHGPVLDPIRESLFSILYRAGFDDSGAVDGVLATFSFAFGAAVVEPARVQPAGPKLARFRALSPTEFPSLTRAAPEWATRLPGPAFESGLSHLINGMRADPRRTTT